MKIIFVYILRCSDESYYTGVTAHLEDRLKAHQNGKDHKSYTFSRRPLKLVYVEIFTSAFKAIKREKQIKGWSRAKKEALIIGEFNKLKLLSKPKPKFRKLNKLSC